jgi:hypothetical protein
MLSFMAKGFFSDSEVMFLPLLALFIFLGVFVFVVIRVLRTDRASLQRVAALPLADDLRPLSTSKTQRRRAGLEKGVDCE